MQDYYHFNSGLRQDMAYVVQSMRNTGIDGGYTLQVKKEPLKGPPREDLIVKAIIISKQTNTVAIYTSQKPILYCLYVVSPRPKWTWKINTCKHPVQIPSKQEVFRLEP